MTLAMGILDRALGHWKEVFGLAFQLTGDRDRAEDLCQETYLKLARVPGPLDETRPLRPLLFTVLRNLVRNQARRPRPSSLTEETAVAGDVPERAQRSEEVGVLRSVLEELEPSWRATLYLRDGLGLSYREIGEALGKSEDTVRTTLHRARVRLAERVRRELKGDGR